MRQAVEFPPINDGVPMSVEKSLQELRLKIDPLERFVLAVADSMAQPGFYSKISDRGFRYESPNLRHFCLLKAVRVVSALNASAELVRCGYTQEFAVLMRTLVECTTHIEYVFDINDAPEHRAAVEEYVKDFFADSERGAGTEVRKAQVPQKKVHESLGRTLDEIAEALGRSEQRRPAAELYWKIYRVYSNYVHAKYPEIMDMYGGRPGRFHLRGMSGTPKDAENLETLRSCIETATNAMVIMIQSLRLCDLVEADRVLKAWYAKRMS